MSRAQILEVIQSTLATNIELTEGMRFYQDLGVSSLNMLTMIIEVENRIGKDLDIMQFSKVVTVGEFIDVCMKQ